MDKKDAKLKRGSWKGRTIKEKECNSKRESCRERVIESGSQRVREGARARVKGRVNQLIVRADDQMSVITTCFHLSVAQNGLIFSSAVDKWKVNGKYRWPVLAA